MIDRYRHPLVDEIFDRDERIRDWARVEVAWLVARLDEGDPNITQEMIDAIRTEKYAPPTADEVDHHEKHVTGHDVVAFLDLWTRDMPEEMSSQIHLGLTSSDVVDNVHFHALSAATACATKLAIDVGAALSVKDEQVEKDRHPRLGRTHGQWAEPTTIEHRMQVWMHSLNSAIGRANALHSELHVMKSAGATGCSWFHTPQTMAKAAAALSAHDVVFSTQVIPRHRQIAWAANLLEFAAIAEDIAMEFRLSARSEVGEILETASAFGSSAMPGKRNPIKAENICGLARLARGYFSAIAENAVLHNDRDISNSSVERVACEDLCHVVFTMLDRTAAMINGATFDVARMKQNLQDAHHVALASTYQALLQRHFRIRSVAASTLVKDWMNQGCPDGVAGLLSFATDADQPLVRAFTADLMTMECEMGL